jgi:[citrate (pro-3S)-lyase] ligase
MFLYTKSSTSKFFSDMGFYEVANIPGKVVFMENKKTGFKNYLENLSSSKKEGESVAAIVMNGISEDVSLIPFTVRKRLIMEGTAHLSNICYHESGPYIVSNATFPSYFQKDSEAVIESHALLDLSIFVKIARSLGITHRYVGEEPTSQVTAIYNQIMKEKLSESNIQCIIIPRKETDTTVISASTVRKLIQEGEIDLLRNFLPETTLNYFKSKESEPVIARIRNADEVIHY